MSDYSKTRSEYMRIMMGDNPSAPYKPENINDVGDTSFDVASLSNDEINAKLDGIKNTSETETQSAEKPLYEAIGDFFSNIGTSITEGVLNVVDNVYDFGLSIVGGIGGGWFGQNKDFTDKIADLMTDNRWVMYVTDLLTSKAVANPLEMATNIGNSEYWDKYWSFDYDDLEAKYERNYQGQEGVRKVGNFVGEIIPSLALAFVTGGSSAGAQAAAIAAQAGFGFARGYGGSASRALSEGATFQQASGYGALSGAVEAAFSAGSAAVGGMLASKGSQGAVKTISQKFGQAIGSKWGNGAQAIAGKSMEIILDSLGEAGEETVENLLDPAFRMIYDKEAWYNAYGTEENRKAYMAEVGKAALLAAAGSILAGGVKEGIEIGKIRGSGKSFSDYYAQEIETSENYRILKKASKENGDTIAQDYIDGMRKHAKLEQEDSDFQRMINNLGMSEEKKGKATYDKENKVWIFSDPETQARVNKMTSEHQAKMGKKYKNWNKKYQEVFDKADKVILETRNSYTKGEGLKVDVADIPTQRIVNTDGNESTVFAPEFKASDDFAAELNAVKENGDTTLVKLPIKDKEVIVDTAKLTESEISALSKIAPSEIEHTPTQSTEYAKLSDDKIVVLDGESAGIVEATPNTDGTAMVFVIDGEEVPAIGAKMPKPQAETQNQLTPKQEVEKKYGSGVKETKPSMVVEIAEGKEGDVFHYTDAERLEGVINRAVRDMIDDNSLPDEFREKYKSYVDRGDLVKEIFTQANLSSKSDMNLIRDYIENTILDSEARVTLDGETEVHTIRDLLTTDEIVDLRKTIDEAFDEFTANGKTSRYSKLINEYEAKIQRLLGETQRIRDRAKLATETSKAYNSLANKLGLNGRESQVKTILKDANSQDIAVVDMLRELVKYTRIGSKTGLSTSPYSAQKLYDFAVGFTKEKYGDSQFWIEPVFAELQAIKDLGYEYKVTRDGETKTYMGFHPNTELSVEAQEHIKNLLKIVNTQLSAKVQEIRAKNVKTASNGVFLYKDHAPTKHTFVDTLVDTAENLPTYLANYVGKENPVYDTLVTDWVKANGTKLSYQQKYVNATNNILEQEGFKVSKGFSFLNKKVTFKGQKITKGEAASIYFSALTKQGILDGTNTLTIDNPKTHAQITLNLSGEADLSTLKGFFTDSEMKVLTRLQKEVLAGTMQNDFVSWFKNKYGYTPEVSDEYFMLNADTARARLNSENGSTGAGMLLSYTWGRARGRQEYSGSYHIYDFATQFNRYGNDLAHYLGYTDYNEMARVVLNTKVEVDGKKISMSELLANNAPNWKGQKGWERYFEYIATESTAYDKTGGLGKLTGQLFRGGQAAVLGLNPRSMAKQWLSDFTVMGDVGIGTWLKSKKRVAYNLTHYKQIRDFMINAGNMLDTTSADFAEYEPYFALIRDRFENKGAVKGELSTNALSGVTSKISDITLKGMAFFDEANNVINVWSVAETMASDYDGLKIGSQANKLQAMKYFVDLVLRTQSNNNSMYVSQLRSGYAGPIQRLLFGLFASDNQNKLQQWDSVTREFYQARQRRKQYQSILDNVNSTPDQIAVAQKAIDYIDKNYSKKAWGKKASGMISGLIMSGLGAALINEFFDRVQAKKDKEGNVRTLKDGFDWRSFASEAPLEVFVNWMPYVSTVANSIQNNTDVSILPLDRINSFKDTLTSLYSAFSKGDSSAIGKAVTKFLTSAGELIGLPISNIYKYTKGIVRNASESAYINAFGWMEGLTSTSISTSYKNLIAKNDISGASEVLGINYTMYKSGATDREVLVEISKLSKEGYNAVAKNIPDYYTNDSYEKITLTDEQKADFGKVYSRANDRVAKLLRTNDYKGMSPEAKAKAIKKVYDLYYEVAKNSALGIAPESKLGRLMAYAADYDDDIIATLMLIQQNAQLADTKRATKKEQAIKLVNRQSMTRNQKLLTLYLMGYGVNAENRKAVRSYLQSLGFSKAQADEFLPD